MKLTLKDYKGILKESYKEWNKDEPYRQGAIISYFSILSLPGLLMVIIYLLGNLYGQDAIQGKITSQFGDIMGYEASKFIETVIKNAYLDSADQWYIQAIGIGTLIFGATTLFFQVQKTLNKIWEVQPTKGSIKQLIKNRAYSMVLILIIATLLLVSLILSSLLTAFGDILKQYIGGEWSLVVKLSNAILSFGVVTVLFSMMYKVLPDVKISWRMVWIGGFVTTLLFTLGKYGLSIYFANVNPGSSFGAAGTVILVMVWIFYTTLILIFGAEFTQAFGRKKGYEIRPSAHAEWNPEYVLKHKNVAINHIFEDDSELLDEVDRRIRTGRYRVNPVMDEDEYNDLKIIKEKKAKKEPIDENPVLTYASLLLAAALAVWDKYSGKE